MTPAVRNAVVLPRWRKGLEQETTNFLVRVGSVLASTQRSVYNTIIASLKTAGVWSKSDAYWAPAAAHDAATGLLSLVSAAGNLSIVGTVTFTPGRGFTGNGTDGGLSSTMALSGLANALQDSSHLSCYIIGGTDAAATVVAMGLTGTSGSFALRPRDGAGQLSGPINSATVSLLGAQATIIGNFMITRTGATALTGYKNGVSTGTDNDASTTRSGSFIALLRGGSSFSNYQIGVASVGGGLNGTEAAAKHAAELALMQAVGAA